MTRSMKMIMGALALGFMALVSLSKAFHQPSITKSLGTNLNWNMDMKPVQSDFSKDLKIQRDKKLAQQQAKWNSMKNQAKAKPRVAPATQVQSPGPIVTKLDDPSLLKKTKKKGKKVAKGHIDPHEADAPLSDGKDKKLARAKKAPSTYPTSMNQPPMGSQNQNAPTQGPESYTLEDWQKNLLSSPNPKAIYEFVQHYHSGLIADSIYFEIIREMLFHRNSGFHELAITALSASPHRKSFSLLVEAKFSDHLNASTRDSIDKSLFQFTSPHQLHWLIAPLQSGVPSEVYTAAQLMQSAGQIHLSNTTLSFENDESPQRASASSLSKSQFAVFKNARDILAKLQSTVDSQIKDAVTQSYESLNALLNDASNSRTISQNETQFN